MMMSQTNDDKAILQDNSQARNTPELGEQVIVQLRSSYEELLHEPLPDNLLKLLEALRTQEERS